MRTAIARLAAITAGSLILTACASKEPLDYLPESNAYILINAEKAYQDAGSKRLMEVAEKFQTNAAGKAKGKKMYIGLAGFPSAQPKVCGVMIGDDSFSKAALEDLKTAGGTVSKVDGRDAVSYKQPGVQAPGAEMTFATLSPSAILLTNSPAARDLMTNTAKRKSPAAVNHALFRSANSDLGIHTFTFAINTEPLLNMAGQQINMLKGMNPKGAEALQKMKVAKIVADWEQEPKVTVSLVVDDKEGREALAALVNFGAQMMKANPNADKMPDFVKGIQAKAGTDAVEIPVVVPKEMADKAIAALEEMSKDLPKDPVARQQAMQAAAIKMLGR